VLICIVAPAFLRCAPAPVRTAGAGHTGKIPDILQLLSKVCAHAGTVTAAGLTAPKQRIAAAQSGCGTAGSAACPPCPHPRDHSGGDSVSEPGTFELLC